MTEPRYPAVRSEGSLHATEIRPNAEDGPGERAAIVAYLRSCAQEYFRLYMARRRHPVENAGRVDLNACHLMGVYASRIEAGAHRCHPSKGDLGRIASLSEALQDIDRRFGITGDFGVMRASVPADGEQERRVVDPLQQLHPSTVGIFTAIFNQELAKVNAPPPPRLLPRFTDATPTDRIRHESARLARLAAAFEDGTRRDLSAIASMHDSVRTIEAAYREHYQEDRP